MAMAETIRVLLADDHPLVRAGLQAVLATAPDIAVAGEATNGHELLRLCRERGFDVLLLDLQMPGPPAPELVAAMGQQCPEARVLVLSAHDEDTYVHSMVVAGVAGYVLKDEAPRALLGAIRGVVGGGNWFSQGIVEKLATPTRPAPPDSALTDREHQVLRLVAQGWDNVRIAAALGLSEQTVRNYLSRLYAKLGLHTRAEAIVWARDHQVE